MQLVGRVLRDLDLPHGLHEVRRNLWVDIPEQDSIQHYWKEVDWVDDVEVSLAQVHS